MNQPVGEHISQSFLIFACVTILVPNTKQEGIRDLWDHIWDGDLSM